MADNTINDNGIDKSVKEKDRETTAKPEWCPKQNIYLNGIVPDNSNDAQEYISTILSASESSSSTNSLKIFGYGSLCWNPGTGDDILAKTKEGVTTQLGRAVGWRRCWAQKSADHRGTPSFLGLVCTLLSDDEVTNIAHTTAHNLSSRSNKLQQQAEEVQSQSQSQKENQLTTSSSSSMTEGLIYTVPPHLVKDCLAQLDFREKGGYSRDVIDVIEDETNTIVKALLYRGTPDNPAFTIRALLDPVYAAATMAVAIGPSGRNDEYLLQLDTFLNDVSSSPTATTTASTSKEDTTNNVLPFQQQHTGDTLTRKLASMARNYQSQNHLYFLFGSGSNQHDQLLLQSATRSHNNAPNLFHGDEAHDLKEIVLAVPKVAVVEGAGGRVPLTHPPKPIRIYAGGGHSALLTKDGGLYLWGWNGMGQLGRRTSVVNSNQPNENVSSSPPSGHGSCATDDRCDDLNVDDGGVDRPGIVKPLPGIKVEMAALGHGHTLLIEKDTHLLYAFGDDRRGQVSGRDLKRSTDGSNAASNDDYVFEATSPPTLSNLRFSHVAAGLFHSAAITEEGELVTFGEQKYGQCLMGDDDDDDNANVDDDTSGIDLRWRPKDGSRLVKVSCGRRHTIVLDEHGRVWSMGRDNKYGQLGRKDDAMMDKGEKERGLLRPMLVDGVLGQKGSGCVDIDCGWSHNIAMVQAADDKAQNNGITVYGWGRNDKAQLGTIVDGKAIVDVPQLLHTLIGGKAIHDVCCGGESIMGLNKDGYIYGCGWNEHGNLSTGNADDMQEFTEIEGAHRICTPPPHHDKSTESKIIMAAGGAHFLAMLSSP